MSEPIVFDDQEIARSEQSTPFVTDRRCWQLRNGRGTPCNERVVYNPTADALLCPECGAVYDSVIMEMLGRSTAWGGEIDTGDGDCDPGNPLDDPVYYTGALARDRLTDAYNEMVAQLGFERAHREAEMFDETEVTDEDASSNTPLGAGDGA